MFLGSFNLRFSGQGRLILPKKIRDQFGDEREVVIVRGIDGGIWGYRKSDWETEAKKQLEISITDQLGRDLRRFLFSGAESVSLDNQGRFVIPSAFLTEAKLKKNVTLIGAGDHFEVWNPGTLSKMMVRLRNTI